MFHVGQPVVCVVDASESLRLKRANYPSKGTVYTIRAVRDDGASDGHLTVLLREVDNSHLIGIRVGDKYAYLEPGFPEHGFRPLDDSRLAIFRQLLVNPKQRIDA